MNNKIVLLANEINDCIMCNVKYENCNFYQLRDILIFKLYLYDLDRDNRVIINEINEVLNYFYKFVIANKLPIGLWSGLTGICFLFHEAHLSGLIKEGNFEILNDVIIDATKEIILKENVLDHRCYDMFYGVTGIGRYFLELDSDMAITFINDIIVYLYRSFVLRNNGYYINSLEHEDYSIEHKIVDLTSSHGIIQIMEFCNICRNKGVDNIYLKKLSSTILGIYNKVYKNNDHVNYIQKCTTNFKYYAKTDLIYAWNYSAFSVEIILFKITNNKSYRNRILNFLLHNSIDYAKYNLVFSNGIAGVSMMLYNLSSCKELEYTCLQLNEELISNIILRKNEIFDMIISMNYSLINGALSVIVPLLEQVDGLTFHLFNKMILLEDIHHKT